MSIFDVRKNSAYRHVIEKEMKALHGENYTKTQLLDYLFDDDYHEGYVVIPRFDQYENRTTLQRINHFWVIPLWLSVCWIKWIFTGETGIHQESKAGKIISKLIGKY